MDDWTAAQANQLRELLDLEPLDFARRLKINERTVKRWRDGETDPASAICKDLDNLLIETADKLAPWLHVDQLAKMNRRDILTLLAASTSIPLAGIDLLHNGLLTEVSNLSLDGLENITSVLASQYNTSPPHVLIGPVTGHLEKVSALLRTATMRPIQRQRLESVVADTAIFVATLSMSTGRFVQATAYFGLAEKMARQASNMSLLSQVRAEQAMLDYYGQSPARANDDPRPRIDLLEEALVLAKRHASPMAQMAISGWLAEDRAVLDDEYGAEQALEWSQAALEQSKREGPNGIGFCSTTGHYRGWQEGKLSGFRGTVEVTLRPSRALGTLETSLQLAMNPCNRAVRLTDLAKALIACNQPREACECLVEAHAIGRSHGSANVLHHVFSARASMPTEWSRLKDVRQLDGQLDAKVQVAG